MLCFLRKLNKYVFTGGPHTGKTSLLKEFGKLGFQTVPEAAFIVTTTNLKTKSTVLPWIERDAYQSQVLAKQLDLEKALKPHPNAFLDRGVHDGLAYYVLDNLKPPLSLVKEAKQHLYTLVFLLHEVPGYQINAVRKENQEQRNRLSQLFRQVYTQFGHKVIELPPVPLAERVKAVLGYISSAVAT